MGNCETLKNMNNAKEIIFSCCDSSKVDLLEVQCEKEFIHYYANNKLEKFLINFNKGVIVDRTNKSYNIEIKPSKIFFEIMKLQSILLKIF